MIMTTTTIPQDDTDDVKLTAKEEAHVKELEHLAEHLKEANLLYGSALDGMAPGIQASADALAASDLDATMAVAEDAVAGQAADLIEGYVADMEEVDEDLDNAEKEQDALLAEDEVGPPETTA